MMRQRGDFECFHEPWNELYYYGEDRRSQRDADVPARPGHTYVAFWDEITAVAQAQNVFVKDFAYSVEHDLDAPRRVVDQRERRHRAGDDAEHLHQQLGPAERKARRAERLRQRLQVDRALVQRDDQPQLGLLVLEEQALAMAARQVAAVSLRFGDGEHRRVLVGRRLDAEIGQAFEQRFAGYCHGVV